MLIELCVGFSLMDFRGLTLWFTCNPLPKQWKLRLYSCYNLMHHRKSSESYLKHSKCNNRVIMLYLSFRELKLPHVTSKNQGLYINVYCATMPTTLSSQLTFCSKFEADPEVSSHQYHTHPVDSYIDHLKNSKGENDWNHMTCNFTCVCTYVKTKKNYHTKI